MLDTGLAVGMIAWKREHSANDLPTALIAAEDDWNRSRSTSSPSPGARVVGILASPNRDERFWGPDAEELTRVLRARRH